MLSTPLDAHRALGPAVGWPHNAKPCIWGIFRSPTSLTACLNYVLPDDFMRKICEKLIDTLGRNSSLFFSVLYLGIIFDRLHKVIYFIWKYDLLHFFLNKKYC